jgi:hypothetical protein
MLATIQPRILVCCLKKIKIRICKTIILPVVLHGCETWSLTLQEEHRLRVFEIRVLRRDGVTGGCRNLHNEELHNFYSLQSIIEMNKSRMMIWERHAA